jgi:translation elongation factor P/translation initiation factor 5A
MKKAEDLKKGEEIFIGGDYVKVESIELSDVGKQGVKKCRIIVSKKDGEKMTIIRPSNYPFKER